MMDADRAAPSSTSAKQSYFMKYFFLPATATVTIAALFVLQLGTSVHAAETLPSLQRKQQKLEQELEQVKAQISAWEAKAAGAAPAGSPSAWFIKDFGIEQVNSAGGVEPYFVFVNPNGASPIKYLRVSASLYNAVGDVVGSSIGGKTTANLNFTGPLRMEDGESRVAWDPVWYNNTGHCIKVETVQVTFINGKVLSFAGKNLKAALAPGVDNTCTLKP
jgi:hypothetical protein